MNDTSDLQVYATSDTIMPPMNDSVEPLIMPPANDSAPPQPRHSGQWHLVLRARVAPAAVNAEQPDLQWQVEFPKAWYDIDYWYGEGISHALTIAWRQSLLSSSFISQHTQISYHVDFERLEQQNLETGRLRRIRYVGGR